MVAAMVGPFSTGLITQPNPFKANTGVFTGKRRPNDDLGSYKQSHDQGSKTANKWDLQRVHVSLKYSTRKMTKWEW